MNREIYLLRHGMTAGNRLHQYIGSTDEPLCPEGAAALAPLAVDGLRQVYVSPLLRCRETAALLFPGVPQTPVADLREMDFGVFEAKSYLDMDGDPAYQAWVDSNCEAPCPGGEDKAGFTERCCAAFLSVLDAEAGQSDAPLAFVVHGGTIMSVLSRFGQPAREYYAWHVGNGRGFCLRWNGDAAAPVLELLREL